MRPYILLILAFFTFSVSFLPSCKKSKSTTPSYLVNKIKTIASGRGPASEYYYYDSLGRISKKVVNGEDICEYTYSTNLIVVKTVGGTYPTVYVFDHYYLNAQSLADSMVRFFQDGTSYLFNRYVYNADGFPVKIYDGRGNDFDSNVIVDGNIVSIFSVEDTLIRSIRKIAYDPVHLNTIGNDNFGMSFLGRSSKNVELSMRTDPNSSTYADYKYSYDGLDRIATQNKTNFTWTDTTRYTYY